MNYWLVKTEPSVYSIQDLKKDGVTAWTLVRNYQARNYLRAMVVGDSVLVYHSNNDEAVGIVGEATVAKVAYPDPTQFDKTSEGFDPTSKQAEPRWSSPDLRFQRQFPSCITLEQLKGVKQLADMVILQRGNRLSVTPVTSDQYHRILSLADDR